MTKFKVGDKVRILDVKSIDFGSVFWKNGDVTKVTRVESDGGVYLATPRSSDDGLYVTKAEIRYIELLQHTPTKNQRITTLESEVAELKAKVEALEKAQSSKPSVDDMRREIATLSKSVSERLQARRKSPVITIKSDADIPSIASQLAKLIEGETDKRRKKMSLTPNELRKAIIAEAKAFVEDAQKREYQFGTTPAITSILKSVFFEHTDEVVFHVNAEKRTVVAIICTIRSKSIVHKAIAKCAPGDVFNADIGKAIALGRALGLDVSRFEQAVKPSERVVGMKAIHNGEICELTNEKIARGNKASVNSFWAEQSTIIDDTEAVY